MSERDTSSYEHAPPDWCLARAIAAYGVTRFCERYHAITGVRLVPLPDDAVPAFGPDGEPIQHQGPALDAYVAGLEAEFERLREALGAMLNPPLILAGDDATEVAAWYDARIRAAIDAARQEAGDE
jgi:hypothetical protein